jgi:hypothetical protein
MTQIFRPEYKPKNFSYITIYAIKKDSNSLVEKKTWKQ